jgi:hypothetical protein
LDDVVEADGAQLCCSAGFNRYPWYTAMVRARAIHDEMVDVHESYLRTDSFLRSVPDNMYLGGLMVRDYLLDPSAATSAQHQQQLRSIRVSVEEQLRKLEPEVGQQATPSLKRLRSEVQNYWDSLDPIFQWTPVQKKELGPQFLLHDVLPRWSAVVSLAQEITTLNEADLRRNQGRLEASQDAFQQFLRRMLALSFLIGVLVAALAVHRFIVLERRSQEHQRGLERAENDMRHLSRRVVQAQEDERKFISRELHDSIGQTMTAVVLELASLGGPQASGDDYQGRVHEHAEANLGQLFPDHAASYHFLDAEPVATKTSMGQLATRARANRPFLAMIQTREWISPPMPCPHPALSTRPALLRGRGRSSCPIHTPGASASCSKTSRSRNTGS